eukprot:Hpha_TRINITY_DN15680_c3_g9::TRINITY_DN15680_c3_g9_i1::g.99928::m.99928/K08869/ADCK, ABC1; aarF domain-containing kinase
MRRAARGLLVVGAASGVGFTTVCAARDPNYDPRPELRRTVAAGRRTLCCVRAATDVVLTYRRLLRDHQDQGPERDNALRVAHTYGAARLLRLCEENKGLYVKIGQLIGQMVALVPDEYVETMRVLFDAAPERSIDEVRRVIGEDLCGSTDSLFAEFDPKPIAAASLAQVHRAVLKDGTKVAVKVQHLGLAETAEADISTVRGLVEVLRWLYPAVDYRWLAEEGSSSIRDELDFRVESANTKWAAEVFRGDPVLRVPRVFDDLSGVRVLTMSFEEGIPLHDPAALSRMRGARAEKVAQEVARVFHDMVFRYGMIHADPHPGNLLIRDAPGGRFEVVLLDHGLYRKISDEFRRSYASLWWALVRRDAPAIQEACAGMGMEQHWHFFSSIVSQAPWKEGGKEMGSSAIEDKEMMQALAQEYFAEISQTLAAMPREMALILKTRDALQALNRRLGLSGAVDDEAVARAALRCIHMSSSNSALTKMYERVVLEVRLLAWAWVSGGSKKNRSRSVSHC